jgi:hypothetical protein
LKINRWTLAIAGIVVCSLIAIVIIPVIRKRWSIPSFIYYTEHSELRELPFKTKVSLVDDRSSDRDPKFDPDLIDSRPIGDWQLNASAATIRIDSPAIVANEDPELLWLRTNYASALEVKSGNYTVLVSANLVSGASKQFDDGLYASIELEMFRGTLGNTPTVIDVVKRVRDGLAADSEARSYLDAVMQLAGETPADSQRQRDASDWTQAIQSQPSSSPIGFYTWSDDLKRVWLTFRALQFPFDEGHEAVVKELASVLQSDSQLKEDYQSVFGFYSHLSNPSTSLSLGDFVGQTEGLDAIAKKLNREPILTFLPVSTSRETELFRHFFRGDCPPEWI